MANSIGRPVGQSIGCTACDLVLYLAQLVLYVYRSVFKPRLRRLAGAVGRKCWRLFLYPVVVMAFVGAFFGLIFGLTIVTLSYRMGLISGGEKPSNKESVDQDEPNDQLDDQRLSRGDHKPDLDPRRLVRFTLEPSPEWISDHSPDQSAESSPEWTTEPNPEWTTGRVPGSAPMSMTPPLRHENSLDKGHLSPVVADTSIIQTKHRLPPSPPLASDDLSDDGYKTLPRHARMTLPPPH